MSLENFFSLTPERVLASVEQSGQRTTGLCYALNSLENRVFEIELEDNSRRIAKFYRPGRWSRETIEDEHRLILALADEEIPVAAPLFFADGQTLHTTHEGIFVALFPKRGGRIPDEFSIAEYRELGRLIARVHNIALRLGLKHRPVLSPQTYGSEALKTIMHAATNSALAIPPNIALRYESAVTELVGLASSLFARVPSIMVHADLHRGNLLRGASGWFMLDFDDLATGPALQDFWLLLPGRPAEHPEELNAMVEGYLQFREILPPSPMLIEALRGLRYVHYTAWITRRFHDPAFSRAFPEFGSERYWHEQLNDIYEQIRFIEIGGHQ